MQALRETIYSFKAKWFDTHAQLNRHYSVRYFVDSHNVEIFDTKSNKLFLKKSACPAVLSPKDFFLGAKVLLYGRHFELQEYLDPFTAEQLGKQQQKSVLVLKRGAVAHAGAALAFLESQQFALAALKMLRVARAQAERLLAFHEPAGAELAAALEQLTAAPVVALELVAEGCVERLKHVAALLASRFGVAPGDVEAAASVLEAQRLREFYFETAHGATAARQNCTCVVVLPHVVKEARAGEVLEAIEQAPGARVTAMELFRLDRAAAAEFLEVYEGVVPHFNESVEHLTTGPCLALELAGHGADGVVAQFREHAGPWDVEMAKELRPHTIRARFGHDRVRNAVHCTDLAEDGALESEYFFDILSKRQLKGAAAK